MDAPFLTPHDLVRPWRRATIVTGTIAVLELVLLVGAAALLFAKPLAHEIRKEAVAAATTPPAAVARPSKELTRALHRMSAPAGRARPRSHVRIMVFNGNGQNGAAGSAASKLRALGYRIAGTANAHHQNYATTVVMYVPGFRAEGLRLAKDIGVKVVGPLDGIKTSAIDGGELVVIVGA